jgi:fucose permease
LQSVATQFFANGLVYATFIPQLPQIRDRVGISIGGLGVVLMLGSIAGLVGSLYSGRVIARFGSRRVLIVGSALSVGSLPIMGFARSPFVLVLGLTGVLLFDVFIDVAMNVQGSELSARRHAPVMNRLHGLWSLGTVAGGAATVVLVRADVSVPVHLTTVSVLLLAALAFVAPGLLRADQPLTRTPVHVEPGHAVLAHDDGGDPDGHTGGGALARGRRMTTLLLTAGGATAMFIEVTNGDWATFRLGDDLGARPSVASLAFLAFAVGMTAGRLGGDAVQVRIGPAALIRRAAVVSGVGSAVATLVPSVPVSIAGFLVAGIGGSVLFPQLYDRAARTPGPAGSGFASMLFGQRSAAILAPLAVGALADTEALSVGQAMAIVLVPSVVVLLFTVYAGPAADPRPAPESA